MDIITFILLILLLNTALGCLAVYVELGKVTLYDLIISIIAGILTFIFVMSNNIIDWIEDKTDGIVLLRRN